MKTKIILSLVGATLAAGGYAALASSHREAPLIAEDQYVDNTDVYAFISPSDPTKLDIVADYVPLLKPDSGPNFYKFSDNARYDVAIDNDGDAVPDVIYRWTFTTTVKNGATFLYNVGPIASPTDPNLNVVQTYHLERIDQHTGARTIIADKAEVAPWNVGSRTFPTNYEGIAEATIASTSDGTKSFAGPRDEPFFVDLHVFDLLGLGDGSDTTAGLNVMSLVLEVPITDVAQGGARPAAGTTGPTSELGIYALASRPEIRMLRSHSDPVNEGNFVQVSRLGWPLVNEVIIPLQDKDHYNRTNPVNDVSNFGQYILNPELPGLMTAVLGLNCAPTPAGGRTDLVGLLSPNGTTPADLLRININADQTNAQSHFPNGRALADDVVSTELTVLCNNGQAISQGITRNDLPFLPGFPYVATPHSGNPSSANP
jgi:hypothetical protein